LTEPKRDDVLAAVALLFFGLPVIVWFVVKFGGVGVVGSDEEE